MVGLTGPEFLHSFSCSPGLLYLFSAFFCRCDWVRVLYLVSLVQRFGSAQRPSCSLAVMQGRTHTRFLYVITLLLPPRRHGLRIVRKLRKTPLSARASVYPFFFFFLFNFHYSYLHWCGIPAYHVFRRCSVFLVLPLAFRLARCLTNQLPARLGLLQGKFYRKSFGALMSSECPILYGMVR